MTNRPTLNEYPTLPPLKIQGYERYLPTAFDESLSILQKMNKVIHQLNKIGEMSNDLVSQWNSLLNWIIGNGLTEIVSEEFDKRIEDGTFDELIYRIVGNLEELLTTDKESLVGAMNEVFNISKENKEHIGDIETLETTAKETIVSAINELNKFNNINQQAVISIGESTGYGVISGLKVTQQNVLAMSVQVGNANEENIVHLPYGERYLINSVAIPVLESDPNYTRLDLIFINNSGQVDYLEGTPSSTPALPLLPENSVPLAKITVVPNDTTINNVDIEDLRPLKSLKNLTTTNKENLVEAINEVYATVSELVNTTITEINNTIGELTDLNSENKSNIVSAINEIIRNIGNNSELTTAAKITIVSAINEIVANVGNLTDLTSTEKQSVVIAINEIINKIGQIDELTTIDKSSVVNAVNEIVSNIGDKDGLHTENTTNVVSAINEIFANEQFLSELVGNLSDLETSEKTSIVVAINELFASGGSLTTIVGELDNLTTTDKTNIVSSINELVTKVTNSEEKIDKLEKQNSTTEFNVLDYGAIGDNTFDNKTVFQNVSNAVNAVVGSLPIVYIPAGTYLYSDGLKFEREVILKGEGTLNYSGNTMAIKFGKDGLTYDNIEENIVYEVEGLTFTGGANMTHGLYFNEWVIGQKVRNCKFTDFGNPNAYTLYFQFQNWDIVVENCDWYITIRNHPGSKVVRVNGRNKAGNESDNGQSHFKAVNCYHNTFSVFQTEVFTLNAFNPQIVNCTISGGKPAIRLGEFANGAQIIDTYFELLQGKACIEFGPERFSPREGDYTNYLTINNCYANLHNDDGVGAPNSVFLAPSTDLSGLSFATINNNYLTGVDPNNPMVVLNDLSSQIGNSANDNHGITFLHNIANNISGWLGTQGVQRLHNKVNRPAYYRYKSGVNQSQYIGLVLEDYDDTELLRIETAKVLPSSDFYVKGKNVLSLNDDGSVLAKSGLIGIGKQTGFLLTGYGQLFENTDGRLMYRNLDGTVFDLTVGNAEGGVTP